MVAPQRHVRVVFVRDEGLPSHIVSPLYAETEAEILQDVKFGRLRGPKLKNSERDVEREQ